MCDHGNYIDVLVPIPADLAWERELTWKVKPIDSCLAPIVAALNAGGVLTRSCCCGHGKLPAEIILADLRLLTITETTP